MLRLGSANRRCRRRESKSASPEAIESPSRICRIAACIDREREGHAPASIDLKDFIASDARPIVAALRDSAVFSAIHMEMDTVVWANGFDLAPEFLHARAKAHTSA